MTELAVEEHQRPLAVLGHRRQHRLHQHGGATLVEPGDVLLGQLALVSPVRRRATAAGTNGGLHHEGAVGDCRGLAHLDRHGGSDRNTDALKVEQVVLVHAPAHQGGRVAQLGEGVDSINPREELVEALGVVPRRARQHAVKRRPVDRRVVPVDHRHLDASVAQR